MHVVATAGHVDHGKSTLVQALTGQDPDRLEEERRRGLSIQLGYCWTTLPGTPGGVPQEVAFVDVPGHERFITTTLAGLGPVPVALLVVAADDPWMPQAAEHLAALDALQVRHGIVVVTRADLADPAPMLARARAEVARTSLRGAPAIAVSARTGDGLDLLRGELTSLLGRVPDPDPGAPVRLWVDRSFHVRGTGTVVTGTLPAGTVSRGDVLRTSHGEVRVRSVQSLGREVDRVHGVSRVALALGGRGADHVGRGEALVTPGAYESTEVLDVRLTRPGRLPERPQLHVGATSLAVHARPLSEDLVRLTLERPLPLRMGDHALLRDPGDRQVHGAVVLDPAPPPLGRRGAAAARARALAGADLGVAQEVHRRGLADRDLLRRLGARGELPDDVVVVGPWVVSPDRARVLAAEISTYAASRSTPARPGVPVAEVARALGLPDHELVAALLDHAAHASSAVAAGAPDPGPAGGGPSWRVVRGVVEPVGSADPDGAAAPDVPAHLADALGRLREDLEADPFRAPDARRLEELGLTTRDLGALAARGHLLRLADGLVLLPGADDEALRLLADLDQPFTASQARTRLGTSRRVVLPLLDHLDRTRRTVRLPDDRRRLRG